MKTYEPMADESVSETAKRMVALAKETRGPVTAKFNNVVLTVKPGDNPDAVVRYYQTESNRHHEEYVNSPEYKEQQREAEEVQRRHDLMLKFAERWARLMEGRMANGDTLEACADEASSLADNEGITGFMYGCAVTILSQIWIHGEQLRRWHNLKTQIGNEGEKANENGGVLNPAFLSLG